MKLIVGLGNPGKEYDNTRHNVGYFVLDRYIGEEKWKKKFNALFLEKNINGEKVLFVKPLTYMNLSGNAVVKFVDYYNVNIDDVLVVHDDLDLRFSTFKLKKDSSSGGHNGINSIISSLGSKNFSRLKVGISNNKNIDTKDYVLGKFSKEEIEKLGEMCKIFNEIIDSFIAKGINATMNFYNKKKLGENINEFFR